MVWKNPVLVYFAEECLNMKETVIHEAKFSTRLLGGNHGIGISNKR